MGEGLQRAVAAAKETRTGPVPRCLAVQGTASGGPMYCGNPAKHEDPNGRPVCGVHRKGNPGIAWYGDRYKYPEGTGGYWRFVKGPPVPRGGYFVSRLEDLKGRQ